MPYDVFLAAAGAAALILVLVWRRPGLSGRVRAAARIALFVLVAAFAVGVAIHAPIMPWEEPLAFGGSGETGGPNLVASVADSDVRADYYAYSPGGEIRNVISLANRGSFPLTVLGLESESSPGIESVDLRPEPVGVDVSEAGALAPFKPTEIAPGAETSFALVITIGRCRGLAPTPTLSSPSQLPVVERGRSIGYGPIASLSEIRVRYSAMGLIRTATVQLPSVQVVAGPESNVGCPL